MMYFKKLVVALLLVPFVAGPFAHTAHAQANAAFEVNPAVVAGVVNTSAQTSIQTSIQQVLNGIAWAAAKAVVQGMTRSIITWINSGFQGSPAFEQNLTLSLRNAADVQVGRIFRSLANSELVQSPFLEKIVRGAGTAYYISTSEQRIQERLRYTLNQKSPNDRAFIGGDFSQGGFDAWLSMTLNSQNNPIGAQFILGQEIARQLENDAFQTVQELQWGKGFLSWRGDCLLAAPPSEDSSVPGTSLGAEDNCLQYDIQTPGSLIESQLGITVSSPLRQLELADSINEIVSALMGQLVTQVIGSTGLLGSSAPTQGGGRSPLFEATDPQNTQTGGVRQSIENAIRDTTMYKTGWEKILGAATAAKNACAGEASNQAEAASIESIARSSVEKATTALTQLNALLQSISGAPSASAVAAASDQFVALISSGNVPTSSEAQNAQTQSASSGDTLYTQMVALQNECQ